MCALHELTNRFGAILFAAVCPNITIGAGIASITYDNNRIIDSTAIHTCLENFIRDDDLVRICQKVNDTTAVWSTPEETCSRMLSSNLLLILVCANLSAMHVW